MNYSRFINRSYKGFYLLCFNHKGLSESEIEEIFSEYGYVDKVSKSAFEKGYVYIRFFNRQDCQYALEQLSDHQDIKFCEHKYHGSPKKKKAQAEQSSEASALDTSNPGNFETSTVKLQDSSPSSDDKYRSVGQGVVNKVRIPKKKKKRSNKRVAAGAAAGAGSSSTQILESSLSQIELKDSRTEDVDYDSKPKLVGKFNRPIDNRRTLIDDSDDDSDSMPALVDQYNRPIHGRRKIVDASLVMVGNIPSNVPESDFLSLFDPHEPLGITKMSVTPNTGLRYCYVYFKNYVIAKRVEQQFDNHEFKGENLVVIQV